MTGRAKPPKTPKYAGLNPGFAQMCIWQMEICKWPKEAAKDRFRAKPSCSLSERTCSHNRGSCIESNRRLCLVKHDIEVLQRLVCAGGPLYRRKMPCDLSTLPRPFCRNFSCHRLGPQVFQHPSDLGTTAAIPGRPIRRWRPPNPTIRTTSF